MRRLPIFSGILVILSGLGAACSGQQDDLERRARLAVRSLAACPEGKVDAEMAKVVALGHYALPDIEQEFHVSPREARLRFLRALERIGHPDAIPFAKHVALRDDDDGVRKRAAQLATTLERKGG